MIFLNSFYFFMPVTIFLAYMWAPPAQGLGEASRIMYFHVPLAWISTLAFIISGILSIVYLYDKKKKYKLIEEKASNSAGIGMLFMILTTVTGSIWSRTSWGAYWNWDPRETSIIMLLLIYIAYFSLRAALVHNPARGTLTSSYLIIAMVIVPFLIFVIPRIYASLHPDPIVNPEIKIRLDGKMGVTLFVSLISFTFLFFYLLSIADKISSINQRIEGRHNEEIK